MWISSYLFHNLFSVADVPDCSNCQYYNGIGYVKSTDNCGVFYVVSNWFFALHILTSILFALQSFTNQQRIQLLLNLIWTNLA